MYTDTDTNTKIRKISKMQNTGIRIYILYNYKLYKLTIKMYVDNYVPDYFQNIKMFFMTGSQRFVSYFYNHNNNLYNKI